MGKGNVIVSGIFSNSEGQGIRVYVHYIVKGRTEMECVALLDSYRVPLRNAITAFGWIDLTRAEKECAKAGLFIEYVPGETLPMIKIRDSARWEQVSAIIKIIKSISTTTNCSESINEHRNHDIPLRNAFCGSTSRKATMIGRGIKCVWVPVRPNFNHAARRPVALTRSIGEPEMQIQRTFDRRNAEEGPCDCRIPSCWTRT
jgi:hypothetical protein